MKFSLIVATLGRESELQRLLESLLAQRYRELEVIIVDQNADDRVARAIAPFAGRLEILHKTSARGACRSRNVGLAVADGDIIAFPDDDCWYPDDVLKRVAEFFAASVEWDGIIGHTYDEGGRRLLPWHESAGPLSPAMSWRRSVTYAYFLRRRVALAVGGFDVTLGPGASPDAGAGDDNEYMLRVLKLGARVWFDPSLAIHHPSLFPGFDAASIDKRARYAHSDGKVLRKHPMPLWWMLAFFGVPLARLCLALPTLDRGRLRFHWVTFLGRVQGFRS